MCIASHPVRASQCMHSAFTTGHTLVRAAFLLCRALWAMKQERIASSIERKERRRAERQARRSEHARAGLNMSGAFESGGGGGSYQPPADALAGAAGAAAHTVVARDSPFAQPAVQQQTAGASSSAAAPQPQPPRQRQQLQSGDDEEGGEQEKQGPGGLDVEAGRQRQHSSISSGGPEPAQGGGCCPCLQKPLPKVRPEC